MSRLPPKIEQSIGGKKVSGYEVLPLEEDLIMYALSKQYHDDTNGKPIGFDMFVSATQSDGTLRWKTLYYSKNYIPFLETGVQEKYPVDFHIDGETLIIKHEHYTENQGIFILDKYTGKLFQ